jgi:hypothetical protein
MQLRSSQLSASVLISVHEQCYVCKIVQEQSFQCSSSLTMWVHGVSQLMRCLNIIEEGGMSAIPVDYPPTVINQSLQQ